jgi:hypothetical protein
MKVNLGLGKKDEKNGIRRPTKSLQQVKKEKRKDVNTMHSRKSTPIKSTLIAPCGMNWRLCHAYIREKKVCPSCYGNDKLKSKSCAMRRIKIARL